MFANTDVTRLKLNLIKGMPGVYPKLVARFNIEGLVENDIHDDAKRQHMDGILDYYYRKFMPL